MAKAPLQIDFKLFGHEKVAKRLKKLENKIILRTVKRAAKKSAQFVHARMLPEVPTETGALRKAIKIRTFATAKKGAGASITINKRFFKGDEFYGAFQELGWTLGDRKSRASNAKKVPGLRFMRKALFDNEEKVRRIFEQGLSDELKRLKV